MESRSVPQGASQGVQTLQTSPLSSTSQETISSGECVQGVKPMVTATMQTSLLPIGQGGGFMNQNLMNIFGASNIFSGAGSMMPLGMPQQGLSKIQPLGETNSSTTNMPLLQQTTGSLQSGAANKFVKAWKGALSEQRQGQPVFITELEGYRRASASEMLAADWPPMMQIVRLISKEHMHKKEYVDKADSVIFLPLNWHGFLGQIHDKKLCVVIQLPSQTLLLCVSKKANGLIGMLFPGAFFMETVIREMSSLKIEGEEEEPILMKNSKRFSMFPIKYKQLGEMYKKAQASFWTVDKVDLSHDLQHWVTLSDYEKLFISHVLGAAYDCIVLENMAVRFLDDVQIQEARSFYGFQVAMENIHSEMYSLLLETYIEGTEEKHKLVNAIENIPCVAKKAKWALDWIQSSNSFAERLVAFSCIEGIFFSGSFCAIFWLKKRVLMPGLAFSNELISRDKDLHCDFACHLYSLLQKQLSWERVCQIVHEALEIETELVCEALPCAPIGLNADLMSRYIKFVADGLLVRLGYQKKYNVDNPFDWM